jgi:PAS domain S-box-containing protein
MKASVSARRRASARLPDRYRVLFDSVSDMVVLIAREADGGYRCVDANPAVSRMEGIPLEAIIGKRVDAIHPPEAYAHWKDIYDRALASGEPLDVDHEVGGGGGGGGRPPPA